MGSEDQSLTIQSKKTRTNHHRFKHSHQRSNFIKPRDMSKYIFYTCDERGHFARDCPRNRSCSHKKKGETREYIMLMLQRMVNLPQRELDKIVMIIQVMKNMF